MFKFIKLIIGDDIPIGLSSLGLHKAVNSETSENPESILGLSPLFNINRKNLNSIKF